MVIYLFGVELEFDAVVSDVSDVSDVLTEGAVAVLAC